MLTIEQLSNYVQNLTGTPGGELWLFGAEIVLCGTIVLMLLAPLFTNGRLHMRWLAVPGTVLALFVAMSAWQENPPPREIFQGLLVHDAFTLYFRIFLLLATLLVLGLSILTGIPDAEDSADFYTLLLGSAVGMSLMASSNNLLMIFLSVEMASVPSYAMAGFLKGRKQSSEAALKYVVYGGAAAGVMLYGLTLLAGLYGTLHLPSIANAMLASFSAEGGQAFQPALLLALMLVLVGLAFKLSAVPFHFWCPDVFEGAPAEVAGFLSVASKGAAVALLVRFASTLVGEAPAAMAGDWTPVALAMGKYFSPTLAVVAAVTCTFGNLAAYGQTNLKRLLAYSTIAHAGYMLMAVVPLTSDGMQAAIVYLVFYLLMNLGAFAVVAFLRNLTGSEELDAYEGLIHRAPYLTVAMSVFLLSLTGMPPLAGFVGKFLIFRALYESGWYSLLVIGGVNTVISLVYYVNVMRVMILRGSPAPGPSLETGWGRAYAMVLALVVLYYGIFFQRPVEWSQRGVAALRRSTNVVARHESEGRAMPVVRAPELVADRAEESR